MSGSRHAEIERLFQECLDRPEEERAAYLRRRAPDDVELQSVVLDLLARDEHSEERTPGAIRLRTASAPEQVGPYRLRRKLGEGGFGEVYEAEQTTPIQRRVALKILKAGMDSKAILARFELERRALALMTHPGIAQVLDAGETELGRSYFAMELVDGPSITDFADAKRLDTRDRLRLFLGVCRAVEHAHQKGVIHRDLKPSNILIAAPEREPLAKVIDFGIAKATSPTLLGESLHTRADQFLGTPDYASPEQIDSGGADIDTRSDVYSLGVVLYRLLTGRLPFERVSIVPSAASVAPGAPDGSRPVTPSFSATDREPSRPSRAANDLTKARELRGDLDWILLRALERDRARRYASAAALADDLERHLHDQPVLAGPPSTWYRARKFMRRRRGLVVGAAAVLVALVAGIVATSWQAVRARNAEREATRQVAVAEEVNGFLTRMLRSANPQNNPGGSQMLLRDAIDLTARELEQTRPQDPAVEAGIRHALGTTYVGLGLYDQAADQLRSAESLRIALWGPRDPRTVEATMSRVEAEEQRGGASVADSLLDRIEPWVKSSPRYLELRGEQLANAGQVGASDSLLVLAVSLRRAADDAREPRGKMALARALVDLADVRGLRGRYAEAESIGREAVEVTRATYPAEHHEVAMAMARLAGSLESLGKLPEAESLRREALEMHRKTLGPTHPVTAISLANLALVHDKQGEAARAESEYREALATLIPVLGEEHREVLTVEDNLAVVLQARGALDEALELRLRVLAAQRRLFGNDHANVASTLNNLGALYRLRKEFAKAAPVFQEAIGIFERVLGPEHPNVAIGKHNLGKTLLDAGRATEAEPWTREALAMAERIFPEGHANTAIFRATRGRALAALGRDREAEAELRPAYDGIVAAFGEAHQRSRETALELARVYQRLGRGADAARFTRLASAG